MRLLKKKGRTKLFGLIACAWFDINNTTDDLKIEDGHKNTSCSQVEFLNILNLYNTQN